MLNPVAATTLDRDSAEQVSKGWWVLLLSGIVSVVAGILILTISWTVHDLALFVAILFIVSGIFRAVSKPIDGGPRTWNVIVGVLELLVGIAFVSWPEPSLLTLAIFIGAWMLVSGLFAIVGAISNRHEVSLWWLYLIFGLIEVPLGIAMLNRPELTLSLAITVVGIWALLVGVIQVIAGVEIKDLPEKLDRLG